MATAATYLTKIQHFEELYDDRVSTALSLLASDAKAAGEIERSHAVVKSALHELVRLYRALYVEKEAAQPKDDKNQPGDDAQHSEPQMSVTAAFQREVDAWIAAHPAVGP